MKEILQTVTHQFGNNKKQTAYPFFPKLGTIQEREREKEERKEEKKELKPRENVSFLT